LIALFCGACSLGGRFPTVTRAERLKQLPTAGLRIEHPVTVYWNAFQVPFIVAESDSDLAYALGIVHAHLRLGQMAVVKRIASGRVSEMAGPYTRDIDHALRLLNFGYAAEAIERRFPPETRRWLERFVDGLNDYQQRVQAKPPEYDILGLEDEPWTVKDLITMSRLAATDVNWLTYFSLLEERLKPDFDRLWLRVQQAGSSGSTSFSSEPGAEIISALLSGLSRSGSNSVVVGPSRSANGAALIASDPHLGMMLPNFWLLVGVRSPSYNAVGMMVPGLPIFGLGRNQDLAWGGTNMRAQSSDLYEISGLEESALSETNTRIGTRFWFDSVRKLRWSTLGPVVSDLPLLKFKPHERVALRWVGHDVSDEFTAFLKASQARTPSEFRNAFRSAAVSGLNMLFADKRGNIGQVLAVKMPIRKRQARGDFVLSGVDPEAEWQGYLGATELPFVVNPPEGFLASANNRPTETTYPLGFSFSPDERVRRLQQLLGKEERVSLEGLKALQVDTVSLEARRIKSEILALVQQFNLNAIAPQTLTLLSEWQGDYRKESQGPVAFELLLYSLVRESYRQTGLKEPAKAVMQWSYIVAHLISDLRAIASPRQQQLLTIALESAEQALVKFPSWGEMHRMQLGHPLQNLPVLGRRYVFDNLPVDGSRETPLKTAHDLVNDVHITRYGSQSRQLSDLSDPDANYFVLLGGQDGFLGSENFLDQLPLWQNRQYLKLPLQIETVRKEFIQATILSPLHNEGP